MAKIYYDLIKAGLWTIDRVHPNWKDEVIGMLEADENNDGDESQG